VTEEQIAELIEGIARNEGVGLEVSVRASAANSLTVTLHSAGEAGAREVFTVPQPEPGEDRDEFINTVRENIRALKGKPGQG